jgi:hypothetical protein
MFAVRFSTRIAARPLDPTNLLIGVATFRFKLFARVPAHSHEKQIVGSCSKFASASHLRDCCIALSIRAFRVILPYHIIGGRYLGE